MNKLLVLILLVLSGCDKNTRPRDIVLGTTKLEIYAVQLVDTNSRARKHGKYEYWVTDSSVVGKWMLITNDKYNIGDTLEISRKTMEK